MELGMTCCRRAAVCAMVAALFGAAEARSAELPTCWPKPIGKGTAPRTEIIKPDDPQDPERGRAVWWYCPDRFAWRAVMAVGPLDKWPDDPAAAASGVLKAGDVVKAVSALWRKNATLPLTDPSILWISAIAWQDHVKPGMPAPPRYVVATNGSAATRPAWRVTADRKRGARSNDAAAVGAECQCSRVGIAEGAASYCAFSPATTVTLCSREP